MIAKIDFLGPTVSLFHNQRGRISSTLGGILTLAVIFFFFFIFAFFSLDIFLKEDPRISSSVNLENQNEVQVQELGLAFVVTSLRPNGFNETTEKRIKVIATHLSISQPQSGRQFELVKCPSTSLFQTNKNNIKSNIIASPEAYYCFPDSFEGVLDGARSKGDAHILSVEVRVCSSAECLDPSDTMDKLDNYYFQVLANENYVDSFSYENPLRHSFLAFSSVAFSSFSQNYEFYLRHLDIDSDDGWIFSRVKSERGLRFSERNFSTGPSAKSASLLRFTFLFDDKKEVYKRAYIKIPEIVAKTGGIMKATLSVFSFLVKQFSWNAFYEDELMRLKRFVNKEHGRVATTSQSSSTGNFVMPKQTYKSLKMFNKTFKSIICFSQQRRMVKKYERFFKKMVSDQMIREMAIDFMAKNRSDPDFSKKNQDQELELLFEGRVRPQLLTNNYLA